MGNLRSKPSLKLTETTSTWKTTFSLSSHDSRKEEPTTEFTNATSTSVQCEKIEARRAEKAAKKAAKAEGEQIVKEARARLKEEKKDASK